MFKKQTLPNLNSLRVFESAGRLLSFKLAAEELYVTPSAVSQQIKNLEQELGQTLFERHNRYLVLTESGREYWQHVHRSIKDIYRFTQDFKASEIRELKVSLMPAVATRVVLPKLNEFNNTYPHITLNIESSQRPRDINKGDTHVAIRFGKPPWEHLQHEKLCDLYVQVVCPIGFTEQFDLITHPVNLSRAPLIQMSQNPEVWDQWFAAMGFGKAQGKQHLLDNYPSAIQAAESLGAMLALIPLENALIASGRVETPIPPTGPIEEGIYAVYKNDAPQIESIKLFIEWLKDQISALG